MSKKVSTAITLIIIMIFIVVMLNSCGNQQLFDTTYTFNYAWVALDDNTIIHGDVQSWKDFDNSDMIQVKINGSTYLTHSSNVVLKAN